MDVDPSDVVEVMQTLGAMEKVMPAKGGWDDQLPVCGTYRVRFEPETNDGFAFRPQAIPR
ncbi:hypothetical protein Pmar_PMAR014816 [Perkinsus marinus ATCC 50983]|uniref:Uncharacterized protein n=2 Tax=Perkinsus marinus (strain ATCC 50983 / TXsc) TaxID=423536 RepID=C5LT13_PERM5|nr:hypothetical protein Pmar_PMAR014816 [Perkinsus marinus ATCC 50983]EER00150.1 hypothetical protein Pmar_PMAR014816 [Perkinsus marinus ATCC 50983]|eukprot:XP_002767432.1 hypothetical protein Pmar_PMAR014816 [Perkinsus marinus ATCC 50983]